MITRLNRINVGMKIMNVLYRVEGGEERVEMGANGEGAVEGDGEKEAQVEGG